MHIHMHAHVYICMHIHMQHRQPSYISAVWQMKVSTSLTIGRTNDWVTIAMCQQQNNVCTSEIHNHSINKPTQTHVTFRLPLNNGQFTAHDDWLIWNDTNCRVKGSGCGGSGQCTDCIQGIADARCNVISNLHIQDGTTTQRVIAYCTSISHQQLTTVCVPNSMHIQCVHITIQQCAHTHQCTHTHQTMY